MLEIYDLTCCNQDTSRVILRIIFSKYHFVTSYYAIYNFYIIYPNTFARRSPISEVYFNGKVKFLKQYQVIQEYHYYVVMYMLYHMQSFANQHKKT